MIPKLIVTYRFFICFLFSSLLMNSGPATAAAVEQPNGSYHLLVFVHGLAGNESAFGQAGAILSQQLHEIRPWVTYGYENVRYQTGHSNLAADQFMVVLGDQIQGHFERLGRPFRSGDRISLIGHSQGGIVATMWLFHSLQSNLGGWREYAEAVDALVSVGTPFWGSKVAYLGSEVLGQRKGLNWVLDRLGLGRAELRNLSHGSDLVARFREGAIRMSESGRFFENARVRPLSIAGVIQPSHYPELNLWRLGPTLSSERPTNFFHWSVVRALENTGFGGHRYESDMAVAVPSARPDFIYARDLSTAYQRNSVVKLNQFKNFQISSRSSEPVLKVFEMIHASPTASELYDMAFIPAKCIEPSSCDHPVYPELFAHLANCPTHGEEGITSCNRDRYAEILSLTKAGAKARFPRANVDALVSDMRGFSLEVNLRLPVGYDIRGLENLTDHQVLSIIRVQRQPTKAQERSSSRREALATMRNQPLLTGDPLIDIYFGRSTETLSIVSRIGKAPVPTADSTHELRIHITGLVVPRVLSSMRLTEVDRVQEIFQQGRHKGFPLQFSVNVPGLRERQVVARVAPTFSTYVDLALSR